jgi:hypothetical protein
MSLKRQGWKFFSRSPGRAPGKAGRSSPGQLVRRDFRGRIVSVANGRVPLDSLCDEFIELRSYIFNRERTSEERTFDTEKAMRECA